MRTDAKIGFAIGGVLLAVLAVYLLVVPQKTKHGSKDTVSLVHVSAPAPESPTAVLPIAPVAAASPVASATAQNITASPPTVTSGNGPVTPKPPATIDDIKPAVTVPPDVLADNIKPHLTEPLAKGSDSDMANEGFMRAGSSGLDRLPVVANDDHVTKPATHRPSRREHAVTAEHTVAATARTYIVRSGQTLSSIAADVYGNARFWVAIQRENAGLDAKHLKVGQKINLPDIADVRPTPVLVDVLQPVSTGGGVEIEPTAHTYRVQAGDSLYKISKKIFGTGHRASAIYALNKDLIGDDESKLKLGMVLKLPDGGPRTIVSSIAQ